MMPRRSLCVGIILAASAFVFAQTLTTDRPLSREATVDDIAALIDCLETNEAEATDDSLSGIPLHTVVQRLDLVKRLVLVSAALKRDHWYPEMVAGIARILARAAESMKRTPMCSHTVRQVPCDFSFHVRT